MPELMATPRPKMTVDMMGSAQILRLMLMPCSSEDEVDGDRADGDGAAETGLDVHEQAAGLRRHVVDLELDGRRAQCVPAQAQAVRALGLGAGGLAVAVV